MPARVVRDRSPQGFLTSKADAGDPNGHRVELAADTATPEQMRRLDEVKWAMLEEWDETRRAPKHAAWMHEKEFAA